MIQKIAQRHIRIHQRYIRWWETYPGLMVAWTFLAMPVLKAAVKTATDNARKRRLRREIAEKLEPLVEDLKKNLTPIIAQARAQEIKATLIAKAAEESLDKNPQIPDHLLRRSESRRQGLAGETQ